MRIPSKTFLYYAFSDTSTISKITNTAESMWPVTDYNIGKLYSMIHGSAIDYFQSSPYQSIEQKAANILYTIAKNHSFENGNKRTAIIAMYYFLFVNNFMLNIDPEELYRTAKDVVMSKTKDKSSVVDSLSSLIGNNLIHDTSVDAIIINNITDEI